MPGSKTFVATGSNSAFDGVVPNSVDSELMVFRATYALSLERETLMQSYFIALQKGPLVEADPLSDKHRYYNNDSPAFDEKRRILIGRDFSIYRHDDLLEGILDEKGEGIIAGLNLSQLGCLETRCRDVHHGINLILGPFSSGKTELASKLCEL